MKMTRRDFLKWSGTSAFALAALPVFDSEAITHFLGSESQAEMLGVLIDTTKCIGCRQCQLACKKKNNLPADAASLPPNQTFPAALSATTFTLVEFHEFGGPDKAPIVRPVKKQCMHCVEPACVSVCPVAALTKSPKGPVKYDPTKCLGCRYCMAACPFNIPKYEWASANPRIRKCDMCADRVEQGLQPACVDACPTGALKFGQRKELVQEAQARITENPDKYTPYIYGLSEVGGTSVMYLANVPFEQLGFNTQLPQTSMPGLTMQVMEKVPAVAVGVGLLMGAVAWVRNRNETEDERQTTNDHGLKGE